MMGVKRIVLGFVKSVVWVVVLLVGLVLVVFLGLSANRWWGEYRATSACERTMALHGADEVLVFLSEEGATRVDRSERGLIVRGNFYVVFTSKYVCTVMLDEGG